MIRVTPCILLFSITLFLSACGGNEETVVYVSNTEDCTGSECGNSSKNDDITDKVEDQEDSENEPLADEDNGETSDDNDSNTDDIPENKDTDSDGVDDKDDQCPNTDNGAKVDNDGCEIAAKTTFEKPQDIIVEAENYNDANDLTPSSVAMEAEDAMGVEIVDTDEANGKAAGYTQQGEWLEFDIDLEAGYYILKARLASGHSGGKYQVSLNNEIVASKTASLTGWETYAVENIKTLFIETADTYTLKIEAIGTTEGNDGYNLDRLILEGQEPPKEADPDADLPEAYIGYTGEYQGFTLEVDERFDTFDNDLWAKGDGAVGTEGDCRFQSEGVVVEDGSMKLIIDRKPIPAGFSDDHNAQKRAYEYFCGEVRTKKMYRYGRVEARFKTPAPAQASGFISSLFTYDYRDLQWREIDIEVEGIARRAETMQSNLIYGNGATNWNETRNWGAWEDATHSTNKPLNEWTVYAFEWTPDYIAWFVDGLEVRRLTNEVLRANSPATLQQDNAVLQAFTQGTTAEIPTNDTLIMMNFWIPTPGVGVNFGGDPVNNQYPLTSEYDWYRYYSYDENQ